MRHPLPELHLQSMNYTAGHWLPRHDAYEAVDFDAPYQRAPVWTLEQRQALIKSLTMGLPIGSVIVNRLPIVTGHEPGLRVIDGKQRLLTVRAWVAGEFGVPVWWFTEEYAPYFSYPDDLITYDRMSQVYHRHFTMHTPVPALECDVGREWLGRDPETKEPRWRTRTPQETLVAEAEVFLLINGAGTVQTAEDLARAAAVAGTSTPEETT